MSPSAMLKQSTVCTVVSISTLLLGSEVSAQPVPRRVPNGVSWGELAVLPEYCRDANGIVYGDQTSPSPNAAGWVAKMGEDFWHVHHYCYALANLRRAELAAGDPMRRLSLLQKVVGDYNYMIRNASSQMPIMPEILLRMGEAQILLGNVSEGLEAYGHAIELKPDYWPPYSRWADTLIKVNKRKDALAMLERGIQNVPRSEELRAQYKALGGDPSKLAAFRPTPPASAASASP